MSDEYLRSVQYWLRSQYPLPRQVVEAIWESSSSVAEPEVYPAIPPQRSSLE